MTPIVVVGERELGGPVTAATAADLLNTRPEPLLWRTTTRIGGAVRRGGSEAWTHGCAGPVTTRARGRDAAGMSR